ncbi:hemolysin family protein [Arenimonas fontis]|uniref:HlyC/CorC family transporter n=1 Tax=Arenimonas fontis TaxID=2608255 RepID=A0A5B2ZFG2_9GAMM|nr:hemolysin family protein [Arenimonas fontis]KAA2285832.1 HlyC/CorC family transporter [Arenimonas fontis]
MTLEIAIVLLLILCNGFFALSEMSVVTSRKARLKQKAQTSRRARSALELAEHPERFLSTVQVGITSIGILTGVFGGESIGNRVAAAIAPLGLDPELSRGFGTVVAVALITYVTIIVGELVPKRVALLAPERIASGIAMPMRLIYWLTAPFVWLLSASTRSLMRLLRLDRGQAEQVTEEEIRMLVAESHEQGVIDAGERNMINRVLRLGDRSAAGLMTPRTRITWLDAAASIEENLAVMRETPYSRYPVYRDNDSEVLGILEVKRLSPYLGRQEQPADLFADLRPALFVSESTHAMKLLEIFREEQQTLALVVDEYGDIQGLVTANDLLDAVLGRVQASAEQGEQEALVVTRSDGSYLVDGRLSSEELRELLSLAVLPGEEDHEFHTAAGMLIAHFGRIPHAGEHFDHGGWRFEVVDLDGARIDKLLIARLPEDKDPERV